MSYRESLFFIIVGTNGTGKTTLLNKLISQTNRKALILDPDGREWDEIQEINDTEILYQEADTYLWDNYFRDKP